MTAAAAGRGQDAGRPGAERFQGHGPQGRHVHSLARIVAEAGPGGSTTLTELRSGGALALRRTGPRSEAGAAAPAEVHLVGAAAGPIGGDRWRLEITVGPGARLDVRSAAATVALPSADASPSRFEVVATVAAGGVLDWAPEPLVTAAGARHRTHARVELADGAGLRWREELACARHGEAPGSARSVLTVRHGGRPLLAHDLASGPGAPGWDSPAVLGRARAAGSLLLAGTCCPPDSGSRAVCSENFAMMRLAGAGLLVTAVDVNPLAVRRMLSSAARGLIGPITERDDTPNM